MVSGTIYNIQRYSIHDGPGIRTVVFFKGCTLACQWCSNPESICPNSQLFYSRSRCMHCGKCAEQKPGLISLEKDSKLSINFEALNKEDLSWVSCCKAKALDVKGTRVSADDVVETVMKDEIFYRQSGGGVTLSGGEALLQKDFAEAILCLLRKRNISTAVETAGNVPFRAIQQLAPWVQLFLYDLKILDSAEHAYYTGHRNDRILANLKRLVGIHDNVLVRMPVIPNVNDSEEQLLQVTDYLTELGIKRLALLPFHQYGSNKYDAIGKEYRFAGVSPIPDAHISRLRAILADKGFVPV